MKESQVTGLSQAAVDICQQHFWPEATRCVKCPIIEQCHAACGPGYEGLHIWRTQINNAAKKLRLV